jgi:hypothetical protein
VAFDVEEGYLAGGLLDCSDDHVDNVPIGCKGAVGERFLKGSCGMDALQQWVIIAANLEFPRWASGAELKQVM